jgi:transposase
MKRFQYYTQNQLSIFPLDVGQLIGENHLVRVISGFVDGLSAQLLMIPFKTEGKPPYHPRMMMKAILYGYATKLYSSRKIEMAMLQDVTYMWLSGMQTPDHNTINRFRSFYFKDILDEVFSELLDFLHEQGYIKFETYFVDGTKIEADANKYSYVWKKNTQRYKEQLKKKVGELLGEIDQLNAEEDKLYGEKSLSVLGKENKINSQLLKEVVETLNKNLENKEGKKRRKAVSGKVKKLGEAAEKLENYEKQEDILGQRNSYSKTDPDATFMRMKNDELKPGYNPQVSTENQFVVNYSVSQNASDTAAFDAHVEKIEERGEKYLPENYVGDAAYGSEENYNKLEELEINNYLKYNSFNADIKGSNKNPFHKDNMEYDKEKDCFICPAGRELIYKGDDIQVTDRNYQSHVRIYESVSCEGCPLKEKCTKAKGNRTIQLRPQLETYKIQARDNLQSAKGIEFRIKRGPEIETFFGDLKMNQGYRRFRLRGKEKAHLELGWLCITYDLRKLHRIEQNKQKMYA